MTYDPLYGPLYDNNPLGNFNKDKKKDDLDFNESIKKSQEEVLQYFNKMNELEKEKIQRDIEIAKGKEMERQKISKGWNNLLGGVPSWKQTI